MVTAVLLIAHGSRRKTANDDLVQLAEQLRDKQGYPFIIAGYLELAEPSIPQAGRNCVTFGADEVLMLPYFLSAGQHVVNDLERYRQELASEFPNVSFKLCPPLGLHPLMTEIVLQRLREGQATGDDVTP